MDGGTPQQPETPWKFSDNTSAGFSGAATSLPDPGTQQIVEWTASEFVAHHKNSQWYAMLLIATLVVAGVVYFVTGEPLSAIVILVLGALVGYTAGRQPNVLPYRVDGRGITVGARFYPYNLFKSFYVIDEGAFSSITMTPTGGVMAELSIYYAPEDEQNILEVLGSHLPMEHSQGTLVDRLARRFRF